MAEKKYSPFQTKLYELTNGQPVGSLLYISEFALDLAASKIGRSAPDQREIIETSADNIHGLRDLRKKNWERQENSGPEEITLPTSSTSADAGYVS